MIEQFEEEFEEVQKINQQKERLLVQYKRNKEGYLISSKNGEGDITYYQRDYQGRAVTITDAEGKKMQMEYDALHQLIQLEDWLGVTKIERDLDGTPAYITDYHGNMMQYEWDCYGNRTKTIYPDGREIFYEYKNNQKLARIQWEKEFIEYEYNEKGYLKKKNYSNGKTSTYGYDKNERLPFLVHTQEREVLKYQYEYDVEGLLTLMREDIPTGSNTYCYEYDVLNRIRKVNKNFCFLREYEYDGFGNRIRKKEEKEETYYQYNESNQLVQEETGQFLHTYEYDKRGNIHYQYENGELSEIYSYDERNLLDMVKKKNGREISYKYDGFGHRVRKQVLEQNLEMQCFENIQIPQIKTIEYTIDFTRNDHNMVKESRENKETSYIWEPQSHEVVALLEQEESYFYQNDYLGSPVRLLNKKGKKVAAYSYEEFGKQINEDVIQKKQAFGFIGYDNEEETGLYHTERRWYNPAIGIFYGIDSIKGNTSEPLTIHSYLFCLNNPLYYIDIDGEYSEPYTDGEGDEAHKLLQRFYLWYVSFYKSKGITGRKEFEIKNGSLNPMYDVGRCDIILWNKPLYKTEIYEIKPDTHMGPLRYHFFRDAKQLDNYITQHNNNNTKELTVRGTAFNPNGLLIPSKENPDYYIQYYTRYRKEDGYRFDYGPGQIIADNYQGMIYWGYVKKNDIDPETARVWIPEKQEFMVFQTQEPQYEGVYNNNIGDAVGWVIAGGILYFGVKAVFSAFGQWWIWACP